MRRRRSATASSEMSTLKGRTSMASAVVLIAPS
jgi:hypothetical protein